MERLLGAIIPKSPPAKVRRNETALAAPAIAVEMVSETAIHVESSGSEGSSIYSSSSAQGVPAQGRRERVRTAKAEMTARVARLEAQRQERRATSTTGSRSHVEDVGSDGGASSVHATTGNSVLVDPSPGRKPTMPSMLSDSKP